MDGRLLAQVGMVALIDSENVNGPPYAWPVPPPMTDEQRKEAERLRILAMRLFYKAKEQGYVEAAGDSLWGNNEEAR
jgi:hypothetical protein